MSGTSGDLAKPLARTEDRYLRLTSDSLHDLASPANQMCSMADLILKKYRGTLDGEAEVLFGFLQNSAARLQNLLAGLQTYLQAIDSPSPYRRSDVGALFGAAVASVQESIDRNRAVITSDPLPELYCDPEQIGCLFKGLIENSIKFRGEHRLEIHVSAIPEDRNWLFTFCDNGIGIDSRYHNRIFGAFKRVHSDNYPGAGVGLAIARQIAERHGGRMWVESELGRGATFYLALPR